MTRVPQTYAELCAMPVPKATAVVEYLADDPPFKIKKGDQFEAHPYVMDPSSKWTLVHRLSDGADPGCNAYREQVKVVKSLGSSATSDEPHFVDQMFAEVKRLAAEAGMTLPELMQELEASERLREEARE